MKKLLLLLFIVSAFVSCTVTKGVYDSALKSTDPYKFSFSGSSSDFETYLKRLLVSNAFNIADFDQKAGIVSTDFKELSETEKYNTSMTALAGVYVQSQKGKLVFMYQPKGENIIEFTMAGFLNVNASYSQNNFKNQQINSGGTPLPQGHPLCMKFRNLLTSDNRIKLQ